MGTTTRVCLLTVATFGLGSAHAMAQVCYGAVDFGKGTSVQLQASGSSGWGPTTLLTIAGGVAVGRGPLFGSVELGGGQFTDSDTSDHFFNAAVGMHSGLSGPRRVTICPRYSYRRELTTQTYQGPFSSGAINYLSVGHTVDLSLGLEAAKMGGLSVIPFVQAGYSRVHEAGTNLIRAPNEIGTDTAITYLAAGVGIVPNHRMSAAAIVILPSVNGPAEAIKTFQIKIVVMLGHR